MDRDDKSSNIIKLTGIKKLDPLVDYQKNIQGYGNHPDS
jgi:hypothetical protein